jgi:pyruvate formate lyase activating enzyme
MMDWIATHLGRQTILHLSRYFPRHIATQPATPERKLNEFKDIALKYVDFVYLGNLQAINTYCPSCGQLLISRINYDTIITGLDIQAAAVIAF